MVVPAKQLRDLTDYARSIDLLRFKIFHNVQKQIVDVGIVRVVVKFTFDFG